MIILIGAIMSFFFFLINERRLNFSGLFLKKIQSQLVIQWCTIYFKIENKFHDKIYKIFT